MKYQKDLNNITSNRSVSRSRISVEQCCMDVLSHRIDEVVLGGTKQLGDFNETPTAEDTAHILKVTSEFIPSLKVCFFSLTTALVKTICQLNLKLEDILLIFYYCYYYYYYYFFYYYYDYLYYYYYYY